jgi:hypothetical protein
MKLTFNQWMKEVDKILVANLGIGSSDMRDRNWRDAYDDESSPQTAIEDLVGSMDEDDLEQTMEDEMFG